MDSGARLLLVLGLSAAALGLGPAPRPVRAQRATPPRVLALPDVEVPEEVPEGAAGDAGDGPERARVIEVEVVVHVDGSATVLRLDATPSLEAAVRRALAQARFEPARIGDEAVEARVRVRLRLRALAPTPAPVRERSDAGAGARAGEAPVEEPARVSEAPLGDEGSEFGAVARARRPSAPGGLRIELEEVRAIPGTLGDPMRVLDLLPGTSPASTGLPYAYVRGAPPTGSAYEYDGIRLPALYHLLGGPGYVHPRLIGPLSVHRGVAPARFGRRIGAVLSGEGPDRATDDALHGELELRAIDVNGILEVPLGTGRLSFGGRYGYPGPLVSAFVPEVEASYWDWQLRFEQRLSARERVELVAMGVYDALRIEDLGEPDETPERIEILFHRAEARYLVRTRGTELGVALGVGHDDSGMNAVDVRVTSVRLGPRLWVERRWGPTRLRLGADLDAVMGSLGAFDGEGLPADEGAQLDDPLYAGAPTQSAAGAYVELGLRPLETLEVEAGLRADAFAASGRTQGAVEPRLQLVWHATPRLSLRAGAGLAHQQAVFFLPLPGLTQLALDAGLQRAVQVETGAGYDVLDGLRVELDLFAHHYDDLVLVELFQPADCAMGPPLGSPVGCADAPGIPRATATAYGVEVLAKGALGRRIVAWTSYTLASSEAQSELGVRFTPGFDVRHVLNGVVLVDLGAGFRVGLRAHTRSGRVASAVVDDPPRYHEERLPPFVRLDAQATYGWKTRWGRLQVGLEWTNLTLAREPIGLECEGDALPCRVEHGPRLFYPNAGVRAEL